MQDVAGTAFVPLEHRLHRLLRGPLRQLHPVLLRPVHDGGAQRKVGGELKVAQPHARDGARLVPLRQPALDAVAVVGVPRGQDHRVNLAWHGQGQEPARVGWPAEQKLGTAACYGTNTKLSSSAQSLPTMISIETGHTNEEGITRPSRLCTLLCRG